MSETQDSPKVPGWGEVWISKHPKVSYQTACDTQEEAERIGTEVERFIPVSALLSDEVVEAVKRRWFEAALEFDGDDTLVARALIKAAIEQVGGTEHGE